MGFLIMLRARLVSVDLADAPPCWALCLARFPFERNCSSDKKSRKIRMLEQVLIANVHQLLRNLLEASSRWNDGFGRDTRGEKGQSRRARSARGAKGSDSPAVDIRRLRTGAGFIFSGNAIEAGAKRRFDQGRDHRQRRHQSHRQRSRHGDAARDRQCRDANQRPADASGFSRRPDGQEGRFSGANRSAPLRDFAGAIRRPARTRPGIARPGENRSGPLPNAVAAKFDRAADRGGSGLSRQAVPRDR